jgi:hypothetical protein
MAYQGQESFSDNYSDWLLVQDFMSRKTVESRHPIGSAALLIDARKKRWRQWLQPF